MSEGLSDDGEITGRGSSLTRGLITGGGTFLGGTFHTLPFLIDDLNSALLLAYAIVSVELFSIAWVRKRYLNVPLGNSLVQVTLGGAIVAATGFLVGHA
jgi:VIT1/CCC1 family predicted Fe2+/Mn2+ transporter